MLPTMTCSETLKKTDHVFRAGKISTSLCEVQLRFVINSTNAAIKAVEGGVKVETRSQAVHLQKHLGKKQGEEQELCIVLTNRAISAF